MKTCIYCGGPLEEHGSAPNTYYQCAWCDAVFHPTVENSTCA